MSLAHSSGPLAGPLSKDLSIITALQVGKYLVTPLTRPNDDGRYAASVSIRSGTGSMTHDRVLRFLPVFDTRDQASRFATQQALAWIGGPDPVPRPALALQG